MLSLINSVVSLASASRRGGGEGPDQSGSAPGVQEQAAEQNGASARSSLADTDGTETLGSVLNGLQTPAYVTDTAGRVIDLNDQACTLFDKTEAAAVGEPAKSLIADESESSNFVQQVLDTEADVQQVEETITVGDGRAIPVERTTTPLYDAAGELVGVMELNRDITERRRKARKTDQLEEYQTALLDDMRDSLEKLADGDLTVDPTVREPPADFSEVMAVYEEFVEMNDDLTQAVANIRELVESTTELSDTLAESSDDLSSTTEEVSVSIDEIGSASEQLADGAEDLAEKSERASGNVQELSAAVEEVTSAVESIDAQSERMRTVAGNGAADATGALEQIDEALTAADEIESEVRSLDERMDEVAAITDLIGDIADQTDLLALNANIEAARAGGDGEGNGAADGFAVVAEEVKSLAEESKEATGDIESIIEEATTQTETVVDGIETVTQQVSAAATVVEEVEEEFSDIESETHQTADDIGEVRTSLESQAANAEEIATMVEDTSAVSEEITASVQQLSASVEQQAAATDQTARTAEDLSHQSDRLAEQLDVFRVSKDETADLEETAG